MESFVPFAVKLVLNGGKSVDWNTSIPTPNVGDVITLGQDAAVTVVAREWDIYPANGKLFYSLLISAVTPQQQKPGRASVEPLRI